MSFKSIKSIVLKKSKLLENKNDSEILLTDDFKEFLKNVYGNSMASQVSFSLEYIPQKRRLIIQTNSKVFASDLILKLNLLTSFFLKRTKDIDQIVIK